MAIIKTIWRLEYFDFQNSIIYLIQWSFPVTMNKIPSVLALYETSGLAHSKWVYRDFLHCREQVKCWVNMYCLMWAGHIKDQGLRSIGNWQSLIHMGQDWNWRSLPHMGQDWNWQSLPHMGQDWNWQSLPLASMQMLTACTSMTVYTGLTSTYKN